jgi:branched-chain amino acid transport system substrate-binding protein
LLKEEPTNPGLDRRELVKRAGIVATGVAAAPLVGASGAWAGLTKPSASKPLRIGNLLTLSGPNASAAIDVKKGFVTYVLAHDHRLGGRKIALIDGDDQQSPAVAIQQAQKLVNEEGVDIIEGIFFSNILLGVRDTIDQLKVPTVVANAAANAITREGKSAYMFRTSYTNYDLGASLAAWAAQKVTKTGMVVVYADYAAGQESSAAFIDLYQKAGGQLAGGPIKVPFPVVPDYQPYLSDIQNRGAKAVWIFTGSGGESIKFIQQYRQFGLHDKVPLMGNNNLTDPQSVLDACGDAALGIRTSANWAPTLKNAENQRFLKQYKQFGGVPSAFAELGYIAAQFIDVAVRKVHGDTSNKARLLKAMENVGTFLSPGGKLTMDPATHQMAYPSYLRTVVKDGNGYTEKLVANLGVQRDPGH